MTAATNKPNEVRDGGFMVATAFVFVSQNVQDNHLSRLSVEAELSAECYREFLKNSDEQPSAGI